MSNPMDNLVTALAAATDHGDDEGHLAPPPAKKARKSRIANGGNISREKRLEQNRKAAIESRRRKKVMVDELKRSVQFYTKANTTLKSQNADLERQLLMAKQAILFNKEKADSTASAKAVPVASNTFPTMDMSAFATSFFLGGKAKQDIEKEAMQAQFAATQALYASMGYPSAAARAAASTFSSVSTPAAPVPPPEQKEPTKTNHSSPPTAATATSQSTPYVNLLGKSSLCMPNNASVMKSMGACLPDLTSNSCIMDMDRIEELNQYAMQQAAAANAAAAAATAAIKAANFYRQMKGSTSSKAMPMPMFSFPTGAQFPGFHAP